MFVQLMGVGWFGVNGLKKERKRLEMVNVIVNLAVPSFQSQVLLFSNKGRVDEHRPQTETTGSE